MAKEITIKIRKILYIKFEFPVQAARLVITINVLKLSNNSSTPILYFVSDAEVNAKAIKITRSVCNNKITYIFSLLSSLHIYLSLNSIPYTRSHVRTY